MKHPDKTIELIAQKFYLNTFFFLNLPINQPQSVRTFFNIFLSDNECETLLKEINFSLGQNQSNYYESIYLTSQAINQATPFLIKKTQSMNSDEINQFISKFIELIFQKQSENKTVKLFSKSFPQKDFEKLYEDLPLSNKITVYQIFLFFQNFLSFQNLPHITHHILKRKELSSIQNTDTLLLVAKQFIDHYPKATIPKDDLRKSFEHMLFHFNSITPTDALASSDTKLHHFVFKLYFSLLKTTNFVDTHNFLHKYSNILSHEITLFQLVKVLSLDLPEGENKNNISKYLKSISQEYHLYELQDVYEYSFQFPALSIINLCETKIKDFQLSAYQSRLTHLLLNYIKEDTKAPKCKASSLGFKLKFEFKSQEEKNKFELYFKKLSSHFTDLIKNYIQTPKFNLENFQQLIQMKQLDEKIKINPELNKIHKKI